MIICNRAVDYEKFNLLKGTVEIKSGVFSRQITEDETISVMGAKATIDAISKINFNLDNIDCIIGAF